MDRNTGEGCGVSGRQPDHAFTADGLANNTIWNIAEGPQRRDSDWQPTEDLPGTSPAGSLLLEKRQVQPTGLPAFLKPVK